MFSKEEPLGIAAGARIFTSRMPAIPITQPTVSKPGMKLFKNYSD